MSYLEIRLKENLQETQARIQSAVCPIYGINDRKQPRLVGSSILLKCAARSFLITAAHVLDLNQQSTLYVAAEKRLVPLTGGSCLTTPPPSGRDGDKLDFGFIDISDTEVSQWIRYRFMTPEDLDFSDPPFKETLYAFVGFPESKNKQRLDRKFQLHSAAFQLLQSVPERYTALSLNPVANFLAEFDIRKNTGPNGGTITSPDPGGISGGGVWRMGHFSELVDGTNVEKLIGIGIEHRKREKALIAVRIAPVISMLLKIYPDLAKNFRT